MLQPLTTASVAPGRVLSEAFQDARAAKLFMAPSKAGEASLFFALPVSIVEDAADLLSELECTGTKGFSGTFIWKIDASTAADGKTVNASVVRVAAVPSTYVPCVLYSFHEWH
jgi:Na+-transporting NADH:ubiquinone oxidoreductase subunit NqrB